MGERVLTPAEEARLMAARLTNSAPEMPSFDIDVRVGDAPAFASGVGPSVFDLTRDGTWPSRVEPLRRCGPRP